MLLPLNQTRMKRMTAIHGWSGAILGVLLYILTVTGAVAVFAPQIGRWSSGDTRHAPPLHGAVDRVARGLAAEIDPAHRDSLRLWSGEGNDLYAFFHTRALNPDRGRLDDLGTLLRVDAVTGGTLERHEGFIWDNAAAWEPSALRRFLISLHVRLSMPDPWGVLVSGILGLALTAATVSGVLMHRHLLRDLFLAERPGGRLASVRDRHVLAGSWLLPFALLLALTGSSLSFGGTFILPLLATLHGQETGPAEAPEAAAAPLGNLDAMIASSIALAGSPVSSIEIRNFGRADAAVTVWHEPPHGDLLHVGLLFAGPSGAFVGRQAPMGAAPSAAGTLYGVIEPLHFGSFLGVTSQLVWASLGAGMAFVILSGLRLWVRRRATSGLWARFDHGVRILAYGLPLSMLAAAAAFFLAQAAHDPFLWTPVGFWAAAAGSLLAGLRLPPDRLAATFRPLLGLGCLLLPLLRLGTGGISWAHALGAGQTDILSVDLFLLAAAALLWRAGAHTAAARTEPAE